jgi:hypothetical protein
MKLIYFLDFFPVITQTLDHFIKLPKHTYTTPGVADVTSLLYFICNFVYVVAILLLFKCAWPFRKPSADHYKTEERSLDMGRALKA